MGVSDDRQPGNWFFPIVATLALVSLCLGWVFIGLYVAGKVSVDGVAASLASLNNEASIGSWASSSIMLLCAMAAGVIALGTAARGVRWLWATMAAALLLMSIDEAVLLHERSHALLLALGIGGDDLDAFGFRWVALGVPLVLTAAVAFWFMRHSLPWRTWLGLGLGAGLFVSGAIVVEMISGWIMQAGRGGNGIPSFLNPTYVVASGIEETLEFLGLTTVAWTLQQHLRHYVRLTVAPVAPDAGPAALSPRLRDTRPGSLPVPAE